MFKSMASSWFDVFFANALELGPNNTFDGVGGGELRALSMNPWCGPADVL